MADTQISRMAAATSLAGADLLTIVQGGVNKKLTGTQLFTSPSFTTSWTLGTLGYTDTNILNSSQGSANSYVQSVIQNTNGGATASTDFVVSNDIGTATTFYGNLGINSSGFTGLGAFNKASATYLTATSGDLALGTTTSNSIHFVINSSATDALTIGTTGIITAGGYMSNNFTGATQFTGAVTRIPTFGSGTKYQGGGAWQINTAGSGYTNGSYGTYSSPITFTYTSGTAAGSILVAGITISGGSIVAGPPPFYWISSSGAEGDATTIWTATGIPGGSGLTIKRTTTDYRSVQGDFWSGVIQNTYNADGQIDAIAYWGYNYSGGGQVNNTEAATGINLENHWLQSGYGVYGQFEYYLQQFSRNGGSSRPFAFYYSKQDGSGNAQFAMDQYTFNASPVNGSLLMFSVAAGGTATVSGLTSTLNITNTTPSTGGGFSIVPQTGGGTNMTNTNGNLQIINTGNAISFNGSSYAFSGASASTAATLTTSAGGVAPIGFQITYSGAPTFAQGMAITASVGSETYMTINNNNSSTGSVAVYLNGSSPSTGTMYLYMNGNATGKKMVVGTKISDGSYFLSTVTTGASNVFQKVTQNGDVTFTQLVETSAWAPAMTVTTGAHTGITANTPNPNFVISAVTQTWVDGTVPSQSSVQFKAPTYNGTTTLATFTDAINVLVEGPLAGGKGTNTNSYAIQTTGATGNIGLKTVGAYFSIKEGSGGFMGGNHISLRN